MKKFIVIFWIITFVIILPKLAQKWVYSPLFYNPESFRARAVSLVDEFNALRYAKADEYFQALDLNYEKELRTGQLSNQFAVLVVTKRRFLCEKNEFYCEPHYLQQTLAALHRESKLIDDGHVIPVVVCSVDSQWANHLDLLAIRKYFPIIFRYNGTSDKIATNKEQETSDYAYCMEAASLEFKNTTKYVLVVEDDAIVFEHFFTTLTSILQTRIETQISRGENISNERRWCWMKLHFHEFWCGFAFDANRLWELFWIATVGGMIGSILSFVYETVPRPARKRKVSTFRWACHGALYLVLVVLLSSRQTWLEMRRMHVSMMQVTPDSGCCSTVAVLYPMEEIPKIVSYLRSSACYRCRNGVDLAIRDYKDKVGMLGLLVQPNLAKHIGMHSTVSADYKDPVQMLFHDMLSS